MSYNYLPLDRKCISFQQVKNLLDYDQLVSITFDAHERILKCTEYLNNMSVDDKLKNAVLMGFTQPEIAKKVQVKGGEEVPLDIVKLMLMLKIKSLSHGRSSAQIETVKRLMEMYNNGVLPVIYLNGVCESGESISALAQLYLPAIGGGEVYRNGQKRRSFEVLEELNWQPISLQNGEWEALTTGTHSTTAHALDALRRTEQLLKVADIIAALSSDIFGCPPDWFDKRLYPGNNRKGQRNTASIISSYLACGSTERNRSEIFSGACYFSSIPAVHDAVRDAFNYVLNVFLEEVNSAPETPVILPDEGLILKRGNDNHLPLAIALDILNIAIAGMANLSLGRTNLFNTGKTTLGIPGPIAAALAHEIRHLVSPPTVVDITTHSTLDFSSIGSNAVIKSRQVINNLERVIAVELIAAFKTWESKSQAESSPFLRQFLKEFRQKVTSVSIADSNPHGIEQVVAFINSYTQ